jgi:recombination DNA repair RAD52 pathway protein
LSGKDFAGNVSSVVNHGSFSNLIILISKFGFNAWSSDVETVFIEVLTKNFIRNFLRDSLKDGPNS